MADRVVSVAFERDGRILPLHPEIELIVKKEIRQHGTDNGPLRRPARPVNQVPIWHAHGRPQPPFKVEQNPWTVRVPPHRSHQVVPDFIEETPDVEVEHPVVNTATMPDFGQGVVCCGFYPARSSASLIG
jgi:hypothetical protein